MSDKRSSEQLIRQILLCFHTVMLLMPVLCALNLIFPDRNDSALLFMTVCSSILLLPTVLSRVTERHLSSLTANLAIDTGLVLVTCALAWLISAQMLTGSLRTEFTLVTALLSFFCVRGGIKDRMAKASREKAFRQHDISWQGSRFFLDTPSVLFEIWYLVLYILGLLFACPVMCNTALCLGSVYLVLALWYKRLDNTDGFLKDFQEVSHIPVTRLRRIGDKAVFLAVLLCLIIAGGAALLAPFRRYTDLREWHMTAPVQEPDFGSGFEAMEMPSELLQELGQYDTEIIDPPRWMEYLVFLLAAAGLIFLIRFLIKEFLHTAEAFRDGFDENGDYIRSLEEDTQTDRLSRIKRRRPVTERDKIRREYRKRVEKQLPEGPEPSDAPDEIERRAKIDDPDLHARYEKARYNVPKEML